jgi:ABC-type transport system involved in Fe-S cluster assembly fused permease/ATPase subunit
LELVLVCGVLIVTYMAWISIVTFVVVVLYVVFTIGITEWRTKFRQEMKYVTKFSNINQKLALLKTMPMTRP